MAPKFRLKTRRIRPPQKQQRFHRIGDAPKPIRPTTPEPLNLKPITPDDQIVVFRRGARMTIDEREELEKRAVSESVAPGASIWERIVYKELLRRHVPFDFQSSRDGGRMELGGLVADFILLEHGYVIQVQGSTWHTGVFAAAHDEEQADRLREFGLEVYFLWDYEIRDEPYFLDWMDRVVNQPVVRLPPPVTLQLKGDQ